MPILIPIRILIINHTNTNINTNNNNSFIMEEVYTYPEERHVLQAVPVVPVEIKELDDVN